MLSAAILSSLIQAESSMEPSVKPNKGCHGLGQITIGTARYRCGLTSVNQLYDPATNIKCTAKILSDHLKKYGSYEKALSAYQHGSYTPSNKNYIDNVMSKKPICKSNS
jgi:soluble lytic murein transglycosylase-like protein